MRRAPDHPRRGDDPVTERQNTPEGVRLIAAGEPEYCSGKANAIAAGMEAARHDRLVWTDDDFHHPSDWLATLSADYEEYGPVSEVPYFVGQDPLFVLAGAIVAPLPAAVLLTVVHLVVNEILGIRRWTAVLAYPAIFVFVSLVVYALARRTFVWGGRRYRWRGKFDVTVLN